MIPAGVITETGTLPVPGGAVAVSWVSELTVKTAVAVPNRTVTAPVKFFPVIVTVAPPAAGPDAGLIPVIAGME